MEPNPTDLQALVFDPQFSELERAFGGFCPFEAAGIRDAEIRHGAFIATMLNPLAAHGYQARLLRGLLVRAISQEPDKAASLTPLDVHLLDLEEAEILTEYRNIDLVIRFPTSRIVFLIELKIDATQGKVQLKTYRKVAEREWPLSQWRHVLVFLTKNEEVPSDPAWISVSLSELEEGWRSELETSGADPVAKMMLAAYLNMLRRHHMDDPRLIELSAKLWAKHRAALEFLVDTRPDIVGELFDGLVHDPAQLSAQLAKACKKKVNVDYQSNTLIRFSIEDWDNLPGFRGPPTGWSQNGRLVLIELQKRPGVLKAGIILGPGNQSDRNRIFNVAKSSGTNVLGKVLYEKWNTMSTKVLFKRPEDKEVDFDSAAKELASNFETFFCDVVRDYSRAFLK